ncbi:MAG: U32 family peptidase C-terminal domain-containing protein, partial [Clostridia bacterium]|nr:U32 family peptidase C-terminal domain-containing protein [Clostridia bacterium]
TYILNSKDLNMLSYIPELADAGVLSLKIEGRMKSEYYLATVVNAYRRALDSFYKGEFQSVVDELEREVRKVVHRDYTVAYALGENNKTIAYNSGQNGGSHEFIAVVNGYENGYAIVEMRNRFRVGDTLEVLSPTDSFNKQLVVGEMIDAKGNIIDDAKIVQQIVKIKTELELKAGDILRRKR